MKELIIAGVKVNALTEDDALTITPEIAEELLSQDNKNFRKVSTMEVDKHAKSMDGGLWRFNGDSIAINKEGLVKDGQHRLLACKRARYPLKTFLIHIDNDMNIDNKKKLNFESILKSMGYATGNGLATTTKLIYRHTKDNTNFANVKRDVDHTLLLGFFKSNPGIIDAYNYVQPYCRKAKLPHSILGAFYYITKQLDEELAGEFIRMVGTDFKEYSKLGITKHNSMYHLNKFLHRDKKDEYTPDKLKVAILIKAWNFWRREEPCKQLHWKIAGSNPETYPVIK